MQSYDEITMCTQRTSTIKTFSVILVIVNFHAYEAVRFIYQPTDHSAVEGKQTHVTCIFTDITDDMEGKYDVIWTKESYIISKISNGFDLNRFRFHDEYANRQHVLRIDPIKREDGGKYRCHFRYGGEILKISNDCKLTIREIPSKAYPLIVFGKPTYKTGDKVTITCFCEKTNPMAKLEWLQPSKIGVLGLTTKSRANNTHAWIEVTFPATLELNGVFFDCKIKVRDEIVPRYSVSRQLHITDGSEFFMTTSKKPSRQIHQQYVTHSLSTDTVLHASKEQNDKTFAEGTKRDFGLGVVLGVVLGAVLGAVITLTLTLSVIKYRNRSHKQKAP
ncbi:uncharacterized protein LOC117119943 [Anneissia japonica]|uniref:uncharacterized protein LOC117119943 n=1 Tax=Anneissia japonica TaxID=1529436 RepID=UPI0014256418|nr:uncharacterized protein LOC117119943 [Anneissia japonica]XP_033120813.1 uncharacterized protein LOC117119943 [Anneissia japonica]